MHFATLVLVRDWESRTVDVRVAEVLAPYGGGNDGFWDWYTIGGRWTGALDGYDPNKDPANIETCNICEGTGMRKAAPKVGAGDVPCNGCEGGRRVKWPTQWARHDGDAIPVEQLTEEQLTKFYRVVVDGWGSFGGEQFLPWRDHGKAFERNERPTLEWLKKEGKGMLAVVVDVHN